MTEQPKPPRWLIWLAIMLPGFLWRPLINWHAARVVRRMLRDKLRLRIDELKRNR